MFVFMFAVLLVMLLGKDAEGRVCGVPPVCKCFASAKVIDCRNVATLPKFGFVEQRLYKMLFLAGEMRRAPDLTSWTSLTSVDVERTRVPCTDIIAWRERSTFKVVARRCVNATGLYRFFYTIQSGGQQRQGCTKT